MLTKQQFNSKFPKSSLPRATMKNIEALCMETHRVTCTRRLLQISKSTKPSSRPMVSPMQNLQPLLALQSLSRSGYWPALAHCETNMIKNETNAQFWIPGSFQPSCSYPHHLLWCVGCPMVIHHPISVSGTAGSVLAAPPPVLETISAVT